MKTALVVGYQGILGPLWIEVCQELGYQTKTVGLPEVDIANTKQVDQWFKSVHYAPSVIILNVAIDNPPGSNASFHGGLKGIINVNLVANCQMVNKFLVRMAANGNGIIVGITSIMGFIGADWRNYGAGFEKPVGYNLSKAALMQYARSLTVQYGRFGIRACCIGFGAVESEKLPKKFLNSYLANVPMGRTISKESAKAALRFALTCEDFAGQTALVDGGYTAW